MMRRARSAIGNLRDLQPRASIVFALLLVTSASGARGEIIDRIAVSVGNRVVTTSEIERQIRASAFLDGKQPDLSPQARRAAADRLVEQKLIERELETGRYANPSGEDVNSTIAELRQGRFREPGSLERALQSAGLSLDDLKEELLRQRAVLSFIDARFRPLVQVSDDDVRDYFEKVVKPAAEAANPSASPDIEDYRDRIEQALAGPRVDSELDRWLNETRARTEIVYHDEAFQ